MPPFSYRAEPVFAPGEDSAAAATPDAVVDVRIVWPDKAWSLAGRGGAEREVATARRALDRPDRLTVFLGSGLGVGIRAVLEATGGPCAVIDRETPILGVTGAREDLAEFEADGRLFWCDDPDPSTVLKQLTRWQADRGGLAFEPVAHPLYTRLDRDYYGPLLEHIKASARIDFWARARYPKFSTDQPRILLVTSQYFLMGEVITACERLGIPHRFLQIEDDETGRTEFVEQLLGAVMEFKPDFVFTINHLGVDREGVLADLLERLELPLASWFVDNPHLILYLYDRLVGDHTAIFTWDADNIPSLKAMGFPHVHYMSLATDERRFVPPASAASGIQPAQDIAFVGNSMRHKVALRMRAGHFTRPLLLRYQEIAAGFAETDEPSVRAYLAAHHPDLVPELESLDTAERRLAFETMITWEATRQYRDSCVREILPFRPLIAGDTGWKITFGKAPHPWTWHAEINYYKGLPVFYPQNAINFNCTSKQMKGAVNQRVFDVPATGSFVLTDHRNQMENLFEPGKEVVAYHDPAEIPDLVRHYLAHPAERQKIADAARARVLAEHTYVHRIQELVATMKAIYG